MIRVEREFIDMKQIWPPFTARDVQYAISQMTFEEIWALATLLNDAGVNKPKDIRNLSIVLNRFGVRYREAKK